MHASAELQTSWIGVATTDKPRNSCLGASLRAPQAEDSYAFDSQCISPSIESCDNAVGVSLCCDTYCIGQLGRRIRWKQVPFYVRLQLRSRSDQVRSNSFKFQTQEFLPRNCLSCPFSPQDPKNVIYFDVRQLKMTKIVLLKIS